MFNVHDNQILSYEIDLSNKSIVMRTLTEGDININVVFSDVLAHHFKNELSGSIILDMENLSIDSFLNSNKLLLQEGKNDFWPMHYETMDEFKEKLIKEGYNYYVIDSSYGLSGWVLAKSVETNEK